MTASHFLVLAKLSKLHGALMKLIKTTDGDDRTRKSSDVILNEFYSRIEVIQYAFGIINVFVF